MQQSEDSRVLRIKVKRCLTHCMYRRESGGVADECGKEVVRSKDKHVEVQRK